LNGEGSVTPTASYAELAEPITTPAAMLPANIGITGTSA